MLPVIALVGRPNVGKSTLFNVITKTRDALVYDMPGVTRDRQYGESIINDQSVIIIDTGGLSDQDSGVDTYMAGQAVLAIEEADIVFFLVDGRSGITADDEYIAKLLHTRGKETCLVVNKTDGLQEELVTADFYSLGFSKVIPIAASHRRGVHNLLEQTIIHFLDINKEKYQQEENNNIKGIKFALIGRPNVGKSTLTNRILREDRVIVYDMPGTTRDSVYIPFNRNEQDYTIIDTAGLRRKSKVNETLEKFSIVKTLQAIRDSHVVVVIIDARDGLTDQDVHLIGFALYAGRSIVIAINKWDGMSQEDKATVQEQIERRLSFVTDFADIHFISALYGNNVGKLFKSITQAYISANKKISTNDMTRVLKIAIEDHNPPMAGRHRIKPKMAHLGGNNPPVIVIHGNQVDKLSNTYQRYLINFFREAFNLVGTPIQLELRAKANPFEGKKNEVTDRQKKKRKRLVTKMKRK